MRNYGKAVQDAGALNTLFAPHRFLSGEVFVTKRGALGVAFSLSGIDFECLSDETLEHYTQRVHAAFRELDEDFRIYQYLLKEDQPKIEGKTEGLSPEARHTVENRLAFLRERSASLFSIRLAMVLLYEPARKEPRIKTRKALRLMAETLEGQQKYLLSRARSFQTSIGDLVGLRILDKQRCFALLRELASLNRNEAEAERLRYDNHLDHWMSSGAITCRRDGIEIDREQVEVLSLRALPRQTFPHVLRGLLSLPCGLVLCSEFKRESNESGVKAIDAAENHFHHLQTLKNLPSLLAMAIGKAFGGGSGKEDIVPDASATKNVDELKETIVRINNGGEFLGQFSLTLILHGPDKNALQAPVAEAIKVVGNAEGSLVRETYNALNAYLGIVPGNVAFNFRGQWCASANYADMALVYAPATGDPVNRHLGEEHLLLLETNDRTPYYFNLHESDLLGVLVFGVMGSGKSYTTNLFLDHSQKHDPFTFVLDVGGSYKYLTQKHKGSYLHMTLGQQCASINPFALPRTTDTLQFLFSFVRVLLTNSGCQPTAKDDRLIFEAVRDGRRLRDLALPEHLKEYLYAWTGDGQYAKLFDNEEDTLNVARFQAFDFQGMELFPQVLEPLLFYIFHRISNVVYDAANRQCFKQLWADEVWRFLSNPTAKQYLISAGKTWRKHNGGIGLITQSAGDLEKAGLLDLVNEICPTKILLANPGADRAFYQRTFQLNDREVELFSQLIPKRQILVKTPTRSTILNVHVDELASWQYRNDPFSNAKREAAIAEWGFEEGLKRLAKGA